MLLSRPPHDGNAQYKRPPHQSLPHGAGGGHHSPPLTGTRGYPYPPGSRVPLLHFYLLRHFRLLPHLVHPGGGGAVYATANHMYRENHFQFSGKCVRIAHRWRDKSSVRRPGYRLTNPGKDAQYFQIKIPSGADRRSKRD
ncbi:nuclear receptor corepressor 1 [Caerostris extrusa]|uniref:Nuclear receptor corepressor 1 n=1 Tax=Caerostris extrusa TaxID=172846 RepID=A0AAV4SYH9_CAEEX|nr:nuclear receptor corepressor 1 [Caerostris extrusa]